MKQIEPPLIKQVSSKNVPNQTPFFLKRVILCFVILQIIMFKCGFDAFGQEIELTGKVVNMNEEPVSNVRISLESLPEIYCFSDSIGNFSLVSGIALGIDDLVGNNQGVHLLENGSLFINVNNSSLNISIFDMMGRNLGTIVKEENLNGQYIIHPSAYIQGSAKGIYIAHVKLGNYPKAVKFWNVTELDSPLGLHYVGSSNITSGKKISSKSKQAARAENTVVFEHEFYKATHLVISDLTSDVGIVELENFGDYSIPLNMTPDKSDLYNDSGTVLNLFGKDSTEFTIHFSPYSIFTDKLTIKAIPIEELEGLAPGVELISAIHLEPGGTKFNLPATVHLDLKDIQISDDLVVFLYDEITNKTYYIPYHNENPFDNNSIAFSLSHFSDIGIGYQPDPEDLDEPLTSDDFVTEINTLLENGEEVPDDLLTVWFEQVVLRAIDGVYTVETLQNAMSEINLMRLYMNWVGKQMEDFGFYDELISSLKIKLNYLLKDISDECKNTKDLCRKLDIRNFLAAVTSSVQVFQGLFDAVYLSDFCNGELINIATDFHLSESLVRIDVSEVIQIYYIPQTQSGEALAPEAIDLEWYSLDPSIASVNQEGTITGINPGTTRVYADYCDIRHYLRVNVGVDDNYCNSNTESYYGSLSMKGIESQPHYREWFNMTIEFIFNSYESEAIGKFYQSWKIERATGYYPNYVWVTERGHASGSLNWSDTPEAFNCFEGWETVTNTPHYNAIIRGVNVNLYPQSGLIKFSGKTFFDQYLSGEGVLSEIIK